MATHRDATTLWASESITTAAVSNIARLDGPFVTIFIDNEGSNTHVFNVQVAHGAGGAGRNDLSSDAGGGLVWYDLQEDDLSATRSVSVASGENKAVHLIVAAPYLRLYCVSGTANAISAYATSAGPS